MSRALIAVTGSVFLALGVSVASLSAQDYRAKLQGLVRDSSQAVVVGAKATLTNINTGISEVRETRSDGHYIFDLVEPGTYDLKLESPGFKSFHRHDVSVWVRADVTVDAELTVGDVSDEVVVNGQINNLQFNTSTMDLTVDHKMVTDLPILARNPFTLALLDPAVVNRFSTDRNPFYMWSSSSIDVGGPTAGKNDLLLDGAPLMMTNKGSYAPPMDAVQEFTVQQNSVDAEFGNSAGGVFSLSLKSGTNDFHGTAYYFGRNPALNAVADAATHQPNEIRNHIWGGTLGNRLIKNKLFTFTSWEQWRTRTPRENIETVPTALERTGDFSKSLNVAGGLRIIYDPWTTQFDPATSTVTRVPFPGNVIPDDRIDTTAKRIMQDIWQPNNPGDDITGVNNFKETYYLGTNYWNFSNRTDWNITDKWRVFGRYSQFHNTIDEKHSVQSPAIPRWDGGAMYALNIAANSIYELRPNLVLEVSGSYGSIHDDYDDPTGRMNSQTLASIWPNQWYTPYTKELNPVYYPNFIVGDATFGHGFWWVEHPKNVSFRAKMGQSLGKQDLKYGLEYRRQFGYISYPSPWTFTFGADPTADTFIQPTPLSGSPYATFLLGALGSAALGGAGDSVAQYISPHQPRINSYGIFFQDDLRLTQRVTLNLGMRYEYSGAMTDANNRISRYLDLSSPIPEMQVTPPSIPSSVTDIAKIPYRWNGAWNFADSSHPAVYQTSKLGFMPRAGVAFKVNDRTVLRGGYARYVIPTGMTQAFQSSMPMSGYTATTNTAPSLEGIPGGVLKDPFPATNPLILPTGYSLGRYQNLGASANWEAQSFLTGVSDRINVSLQRQLPQQFLLDVTYFVNLSHNLPYTLSLNQMDPQLSYTYKGLLSESIANPFYQYLTSTTFPGQLRNQNAVTVGSLLSMYPQYGGLQQLNTPGVKDKYYALQMRVQRRFWQGFGILWGYNFSREAKQDWFNAPDQFANRFTYIDSNNPRHRIIVAGTCDLPFGKGRWLLSDANALVNAIVGGWSSSGIFTYVSGEYLRFGQLNVTGNPAIFEAPDQYFNTSVFSPPTPYTPRTNPWQYPGVTGPRFVNVDATIAKFFAVGERLRLEFRMEAYNASNSFMAKKPSTDINSSLFGRSTGQANIGRQIQYTLRLHF